MAVPTLTPLSNMEISSFWTAGGVLPYTHEELSVSLGLNRSTVTTVLKKFEQEGWLKRGYGFIKVLDRQALQEIVEQQKNR